MSAAEGIQRYQQYVHLIVLAAGIYLHLGYFQRGDHHMFGLRYLQAFTLLFSALTVALTLRHDLSWVLSISISSFIFGHLILGLYGSLLSYRLVWHPLRVFRPPSELRSAASSLAYTLGIVMLTKGIETIQQVWPVCPCRIIRSDDSSSLGCPRSTRVDEQMQEGVLVR